MVDPLSLQLESLQQQHQQNLLHSNFFSMIRFWSKMCHVSRVLGGFRRDTRNDCLRSMLQTCLPDFLPSASIYAPVGNTRHRIWAVHPEECFAFSTKSRAPILLCLGRLCTMFLSHPWIK